MKRRGYKCPLCETPDVEWIIEDDDLSTINHVFIWSVAYSGILWGREILGQKKKPVTPGAWE